MSEDLRYPIGKLVRRPAIDAATREQLIADIEQLPAELRAAVQGLSDAQLDTPYRDGGWTVRQVVHHLADSHMNAFIRMRLTVTEDNPTIKPYEENDWAQLADSRHGGIELSLPLLDTLHRRWIIFLRSLDAAAFDRPLTHPDIGPLKLHDLLQIYGWHCRHHLGHITALRQRQGWAHA